MGPVDVVVFRTTKRALDAPFFYATAAGNAIAVGRPLTRLAISSPLPAAIVQPSVPWPVFRKSAGTRVAPKYGMFEGVSGRNPAQ